MSERESACVLNLGAGVLVKFKSHCDYKQDYGNNFVRIREICVRVFTISPSHLIDFILHSVFFSNSMLLKYLS